jgi:hypothetical protein
MKCVPLDFIDIFENCEFEMAKSAVQRNDFKMTHRWRCYAGKRERERK